MQNFELPTITELTQRMYSGYDQLDHHYNEFTGQMQHSSQELSRRLSQLKLPIPLLPEHSSSRPLFGTIRAYKRKPTFPFSLFATFIAILWILLAYFNILPFPIPLHYLLSAWIVLEISFYFVFRARLKQLQHFSTPVQHSDQNSFLGRLRVYSNMLNSLSLDRYGDTSDTTFFFMRWFLDTAPRPNPNALFLQQQQHTQNDIHTQNILHSQHQNQQIETIIDPSLLDREKKNIHLPTIPRGNMLQWVSWAMFSRFPNQLTVDESQECLNYITLLERVCPTLLFPHGFQPDIKSMRLSLEQVQEALHRPLISYYLVSCLQSIVKLILHYYLGFERKKSGATYYWYRPKALNHLSDGPDEVNRIQSDRSTPPIIFMHGIGHGLIYYLHFLSKLTFSYDVLLIELPFISNRFFETPEQSDTIVSAVGVILAEHNYNKAIFVSHSYGTFITAWCLKFAPHLIHSVFLLDPVALLLCLPTTCHTFVYAKSRNLMDLVRRLFVSSEFTIASTMRRGFFWIDMSLFLSDLPKIRQRLEKQLIAISKDREEQSTRQRLLAMNAHHPHTYSSSVLDTSTATNTNTTSTTNNIPHYTPLPPPSSLTTTTITTTASSPTASTIIREVDDETIDTDEDDDDNNIHNNNNNNNNVTTTILQSKTYSTHDTFSIDSNISNDHTTTRPSRNTSVVRGYNAQEEQYKQSKEQGDLLIEFTCNQEYAYYPSHVPQSLRGTIGDYCPCFYAKFYKIQQELKSQYDQEQQGIPITSTKTNVNKKDMKQTSSDPPANSKLYQILGFEPLRDEIDVYGCFDIAGKPDPSYSNYLKVPLVPPTDTSSSTTTTTSSPTTNTNSPNPNVDDDNSPQNSIPPTPSSLSKPLLLSTEQEDDSTTISTTDSNSTPPQPPTTPTSSTSKTTTTPDDIDLLPYQIKRQSILECHRGNLQYWSFRPDGSLDMTVLLPTSLSTTTTTTTPSTTTTTTSSTPSTQTQSTTTRITDSTSSPTSLDSKLKLCPTDVETSINPPSTNKSTSSSTNITDLSQLDSSLSSLPQPRHEFLTSSQVLQIPNVSGIVQYPPRHIYDKIPLSSLSSSYSMLGYARTPILSQQNSRIFNSSNNPSPQHSTTQPSSLSTTNLHQMESLNDTVLPPSSVPTTESNSSSIILHTTTISPTHSTTPNSLQQLSLAKVPLYSNSNSNHSNNDIISPTIYNGPFSPLSNSFSSNSNQFIPQFSRQNTLSTISTSQSIRQHNQHNSSKSASGVGLLHIRQNLDCGCLGSCVCGAYPDVTQDTSHVFYKPRYSSNDCHNPYYMVWNRENGKIILPHAADYQPIAIDSIGSPVMINNIQDVSSTQLQGGQTEILQHQQQFQHLAQMQNEQQHKAIFNSSSSSTTTTTTTTALSSSSSNVPPTTNHNNNNNNVNDTTVAHDLMRIDTSSGLNQPPLGIASPTYFNPTFPSSVTHTPPQQVKIAILLGGLDDLVPSDRIVRHFRMWNEKMYGPQIQYLKSNIIHNLRQDYLHSQQEQDSLLSSSSSSSSSSTTSTTTTTTTTNNQNVDLDTLDAITSTTTNQIQDHHYEYTHTHYHMFPWNHSNNIPTGKLQLETSDVHLNNVFAAKPRNEYDIQADILTSLEHGLVHRYDPERTQNNNTTNNNNSNPNHSNNLHNSSSNPSHNPMSPTTYGPNSISLNQSQLQSNEVDLKQYYNTTLTPGATLKSTIRTRILYNPGGTHASFLLEDRSHLYELFSWLREP